ncbi:M4 family metallopeptidase [Longispora urticae]
MYAPGGPRFARLSVTGEKRVYTDAVTGAPIASFDEVSHDVGRGHHNGQVDLATTAGTLKDPGRDGLLCGPETTKQPYTNTTTTWGTGDAQDLVTACVDAYYGAAKQYDMLRDWLGRSGIDGTGKAFPLYVGWDAANAYWYTGSGYARFGHNTKNTKWLTSLDVVGHELGHAIFQHTPGGYGTPSENYPLNEATADIFGVLTEFYAANPNDPGDYDIGEEVDFAGDGKPIRYMYDSAKAGQRNCYEAGMPTNDYYSAGGPLRHWFYLAAEGSQPTNGRPASPTCDNSTVKGLSLRTAGEIFYNALLRKTSAWDYAAVRRDTLAAARQLFPNGCAEFTAVRDAWNAVSVPAQPGEATCAGTPSPTASPAGRTFRDGTARPIADLATTTGSVTTNLTGAAASPVTLTVTIEHSCAEDLTVTLRGPDNRSYPVLASRSGACTRWSGARTFTVPSVTSPAGGTWKLLVADNYRQDTGTLTAWTVTL